MVYPSSKMGKQRFKALKLFLKLILLFQIYSHLKFTVEASGFSKSSEECELGVRKNFKYHITKNETDETVPERPKRPARLLPLRMIL